MCCYSLGCISTLPGQGFRITLRTGGGGCVHPRGSELPPERVENFAAHLSWKSNYCIFVLLLLILLVLYKKCFKTEKKRKK